MNKLNRDNPISVLDTINQLKAERDALAAQIEMLQKHIERVALCYYNNTGNEPSLSVFHRALDEAESAVFKESHQCLAEIRAEAVLQFAHWAFDTCPNIDCMFDDKDDYIAKIRQGGAE